MPVATMNQSLITRVQDLHDGAVRQLVAAHARRTEEPLVLAVRFEIDDPTGDIHLLEILDQFPGGDEDELLVTEFGPSASLIILGKLHLVLGSPAQVRSALKRGDSSTAAMRGGEVVFDNRSAEATGLRKELGL